MKCSLGRQLLFRWSKVELVLCHGSELFEFIFIFNGSDFLDPSFWVVPFMVTVKVSENIFLFAKGYFYKNRDAEKNRQFFWILIIYLNFLMGRDTKKFFLNYFLLYLLYTGS